MLDVLLTRQSVLDRLETAPLRSGELAADLEHSRSTVDRAVAELNAAGLAERTAGRYRTTVAGTLVLEEFERLTRQLSSTRALSSDRFRPT